MKFLKSKPVGREATPGVPDIQDSGSAAAQAAQAAMAEQRILSTHGRASTVLTSDPLKRARDALGVA